MIEFVENTDGKEAEKQDCERKVCYRLMDHLKKEFPHLPVCLSADSLYECENFFKKCQENGWHYMIRFKEESIPVIADEFEKLKKIEGNRREQKLRNGICWHDFITGIDYNGSRINMVEYVEERWKEKEAQVKERKRMEGQDLYSFDISGDGRKKLWEKAGLNMGEKQA